MTTQNLNTWLLPQEGYRVKPYKDSRGFWTGGVGHLLNGGLSPSHPIDYTNYTDDQWMAILKTDIDTAEKALDHYLPWWRKLSDVRQDVMVALAFNLGASKFATWKHTLDDIENGRFEAAKIDLENDEPWASQVKGRAKLLALQMETNKEV